MATSTMSGKPTRLRCILTDDEATARLVAIDRTAEFAGNDYSAGARDRVRRILAGEITGDEARAEILVKYP